MTALPFARKVNDDLMALIKVRISEYKKAEKEKAEATRKRIREEELQRIADEEKAKLAMPVSGFEEVDHGQEMTKMIGQNCRESNSVRREGAAVPSQTRYPSEA
jgi:hypothetical protein